MSMERRAGGSHVHFWAGDGGGGGDAFMPKEQSIGDGRGATVFAGDARGGEGTGEVSECGAGGCYGQAGSRAGGDGGWKLRIDAVNENGDVVI